MTRRIKIAASNAGSPHGSSPFLDREYGDRCCINKVPPGPLLHPARTDFPRILSAIAAPGSDGDCCVHCNELIIAVGPELSSRLAQIERKIRQSVAKSQESIMYFTVDVWEIVFINPPDPDNTCYHGVIISKTESFPIKILSVALLSSFLSPENKCIPMRPSYLGKILLRWCETATRQSFHTAVPAVQKPATSPSHPRAMPVPHFQMMLHSSKEFSTTILALRSYRMEISRSSTKYPTMTGWKSIIGGGGIAGIIRYLPRQRRWEPIPRPEACTCSLPKNGLSSLTKRRPVHQGPGMSVLAPGLFMIDDSVVPETKSSFLQTMVHPLVLGGQKSTQQPHGI